LGGGYDAKFVTLWEIENNLKTYYIHILFKIKDFGAGLSPKAPPLDMSLVNTKIL